MKRTVLRIIPVLLVVIALIASIGCQPRQTPPTTPATPATPASPATPATPETPASPEATSPTPDGATSSSEPEFKVGDSVAAPWGGRLYAGVIKEMKEKSADVEYIDDKVVRPVELKDLKMIVKKTWKPDDKVLGVWSAGAFYEGTIVEVKDDEVYVIKWDDGSDPSEVKADKIMDRPEK